MLGSRSVDILRLALPTSWKLETATTSPFRSTAHQPRRGISYATSRFSISRRVTNVMGSPPKGDAIVALLVAVLAVANCYGCGTPVSDEYLAYAQMSYDASAFNRLGVGDLFELRVYREEDLSGVYTVSDEGDIDFPMIGAVEVDGRTCREVQNEVRDRLGAEYLRNPTVQCSVTELNSLRVIVTGEVNAPGRFPYADNLTVVEALALAGGVNENSSDERVIITRDVNGETIDIEVPIRAILRGSAPNFRLWPNDIVTVPPYRLIR